MKKKKETMPMSGIKMILDAEEEKRKKENSKFFNYMSLIGKGVEVRTDFKNQTYKLLQYQGKEVKEIVVKKCLDEYNSEDYCPFNVFSSGDAQSYCMLSDCHLNSSGKIPEKCPLKKKVFVIRLEEEK